jgi:hypothetical protein
MYLKVNCIDDFGGKYIISSNLSFIEFENNEFDFILEFNELNDLKIYYFTDDCDDTTVEQNPLLIIPKGRIIKYNKDKITDSKILEYIESKIKNNDFIV